VGWRPRPASNGMDIKYLNLEFWFYQIYLLFKTTADFFAGGGTDGAKGAVSSLGAVAFSLISLAALLGILIYLLFAYGLLSAATLIPLALIGLLSSFLYISGIAGVNTILPLAFLGMLSSLLYFSGAVAGATILPAALFGLGLSALYFTGIIDVYTFYSILFFGWLLYSLYKMKKLREKEEADFLSAFAIATDPKVDEAEEWLDIIDHIDSENESQWKLALIDADKILENLLRENGYDGDGVGARLKTAELQGGIKSLQDAWEAHKIRNRIAHETGFVLTKREARRAVELYKKTFEELGFL
jgi:hypothetical protein